TRRWRKRGSEGMTRPEARRNQRDVLAGAVTAVAGLILFTTARTITSLPGDTEVIGPATFPTISSVILVIAGLALCLNGFRGPGSGDGDGSIGEAPLPWPRLVVMIGATTAYLASVSCVIDRTRWRRNLVFAVGFSAAVYLVFTRLLAVELPDGVLTWTR
ncbi:MAG: hypothetical protein K0R68_209, partial [Mycobacterium sp.]|nr:hypothetical protein [Mycobacterium sp.]